MLTELEIFQMLCEKSHTWLSDNIGVVLGVTLGLSSYGLPHHAQSIPHHILPTPLHPDSKSDVKKVTYRPFVQKYYFSIHFSNFCVC